MFLTTTNYTNSYVPSVASGKAERNEFKSVKSVKSVVKRKLMSMKKQRIIELAVKVIVAALTAFLTALGTTSCMGHGPF